MPGKRPHVPASLHSELSEYSSLLRALRTSNTLDLASQLTSSSPVGRSRTYVNDDDGQDDDESESEKFATGSGSVSADGSQASSSKSKLKTKSKCKVKEKDNRTRWPLLAGDVYVPEWGLEDEVKLLALRTLQCEGSLYITDDLDASPPSSLREATSNPELDAQSSPHDSAYSSSRNLATEPNIYDFEQLLTPQYLAALTSSAGLYLSRILGLLAAYVPQSGKSMQNRVRPIGWQSVLDIVAVNNLASPEYVINLSPTQAS